jgi:hypothetical protein
LFRLLYDIPAEVYVPKVDLLRVSDGKFSKDTIIQVVDNVGDTIELIGETIRQGTSLASVENVLKYRFEDKIITQIFINPFSIVGQFNATDPIVGKSNIDGSTIIANIESGIVKINLDDYGLYYSVGDKIKFISAEGSGAIAQVSLVNSGSIKEIQVSSKGSGYSIGDEVLFDNTNAGVGLGGSLVTARAVVTEVDADSLMGV